MSNQDKRSRYNDSSIKALGEAEFTRKNPQSALGSNNIEGAKHGAGELFANAQDEAGQGFGTKIEVTQMEDGSVILRDYGRGVPLGWNEAYDEWNYNLVFNKLHAGGKYDTAEDFDKLTDLTQFREEDYDNLTTVGLYGVGASATQFTSRFFEVTSIREGLKRTMRFERGEQAWPEMKEEPSDEPTGTRIHWLPDEEVFSGESVIPQQWLMKQCEQLAITSGIDAKFTGKSGEVKEFPATSIDKEIATKLGDYAEEDKRILTRNGRGENFFAHTHALVGPAKSGVAQMKFYQNRIEVHNGDHSHAVTVAINNFFASLKLDDDIKIKAEDTAGMLVVWANCRANRVNWDSLTKDRVNDSAHIYNSVYGAVNDALHKAWARGSDWLVDIVETAKHAAALRIERENLRVQVREISKTMKKNSVLPLKFAPSRHYTKKNYADSELWIGEGDSATGGLTGARDVDTQSTYPIRGKSLNVFKANLARIIGNAEIQGLIQILGAGVDLSEIDDALEAFDINKLRFNKIILAADADKDGYHIRTLVVTMFYRLFPDILRHGMLYFAETPIYKYKPTGQYFYTEAEFNEFANGRTFSKDELARYKGLGSLNAKELRDTTMIEGTRRLIQVQFEPNDTEIYDVFNAMFGKDSSNRKRVILQELLVGENYEDVEAELYNMDKFVQDEEIEDVREYETVTF